MLTLKKCKMCPRKCKINRETALGFCGANEKIKIAKAYLHQWEEPPITGKYGSGTVFFSHCNLKCIYCQNYEISHEGKGIEIEIDELKNIFLYLQKQKATNINLVTPTHYILQIKEALQKAKKEGLSIPIVYNSSGYEDVEALKELEGLIDIYLVDMKYYDDTYAIKYSKANHYFEICSKAIKEMYRQVGNIKIKNEIMQRGILVRHLLLPGLIENSKKILQYLHHTYNNTIFISIMNQYTPLDTVKERKELNRKITKEEYNEVVNYAIDLGIENAFIQEEETALESFIPEFNLEEMKKDINQSKEKI